MASSRDQLEGMIDRFSPEIASLSRGVLSRVRQMLPGAVEMVYDNAYALVVGFGATDKASEAVVSVVMRPNRVSVCFLWGVDLADPDELLQGSGKQVRYIRAESAEVLDDPRVKRLVGSAVGALGLKFGGGKREVQIRAVSGNLRPRRPDGPPPSARKTVRAKTRASAGRAGGKKD